MILSLSIWMSCAGNREFWASQLLQKLEERWEKTLESGKQIMLSKEEGCYRLECAMKTQLTNTNTITIFPLNSVNECVQGDMQSRRWIYKCLVCVCARVNYMLTFLSKVRCIIASIKLLQWWRKMQVIHVSLFYCLLHTNPPPKRLAPVASFWQKLIPNLSFLRLHITRTHHYACLV